MLQNAKTLNRPQSGVTGDTVVAISGEMGRWFRKLLSQASHLGLYLAPHGRRRELQESLDHLADRKRQLEQTAHAMELRFLAAGAGLQQLTALGENLLDQSHQLTREDGASAKGRKALQSGADRVRQQLEFVEKCQTINARLILRLEDYTSRVQKLQKCGETLDQILIPLTTVGMLYKIQSASLTGEHKVFFAALTQDISALQQEARAAFTEQFQCLKVSRDTILTAIPSLKESSDRQGQALAGTKLRVENCLTALQRELQQSTQRHANLIAAAKQISTHAGEAVVGLQYQDITRQKWEHVSQALGDACENVRPVLRRWRMSPAPIRLLRDTCRIQARQVASIESDLSMAQTSVSEGIQNIFNAITAMDQECQNLRGRESGTNVVDAMVVSLENAMIEVQVWVNEISDISRHTAEVLNSLDKTVSDVAGTLHRLSFGLGLIAVNAQVQAAQLGHESGLGVLSEQTCQAAREIQQFSDTEGGTFDHLAVDLDAIKKECNGLWEQIQSEQHWLQGQGLDLGRQLRDCQAQIQADVRTVASSLEELHQEASSALESINFKTSFSSEFQSLRARIEDCEQATARLLCGTRELAESHKEDLEQLKSNYTMESERVVHAVALDTPPGAEEIPEPIRPSKGRRPHPSTMVLDARVETDVSLTPPAAPATKPADPSGLGDNVDLF